MDKAFSNICTSTEHNSPFLYFKTDCFKFGTNAESLNLREEHWCKVMM